MLAMQPHDNSSKSQRKIPSQARSKELVKSIFEATVRILPKVGSYQITTKKIAEMAGVSIGSLYQYFPNKEVLLGSLMDTMMKDTSEKVFKTIDELEGLSLEEFASRFIDFTLEIFLKEKEKVAEIYRRAPELSRVPQLLKMRREVVARLARLLRQQRPELNEEDSLRMVFVTTNSVLGVVHTMIYDTTQSYSNEQLAKELKKMVTTYLKRNLEVPSQL